jgi:hypothetical protein
MDASTLIPNFISRVIVGVIHREKRRRAIWGLEEST